MTQHLVHEIYLFLEMLGVPNDIIIRYVLFAWLRCLTAIYYSDILSDLDSGGTVVYHSINIQLLFTCFE